MRLDQLAAAELTPLIKRVVNDVVKVADDINEAYRQNSGEDFDLLMHLTTTPGPVGTTATVVFLADSEASAATDTVQMFMDELDDRGMIGDTYPAHIAVSGDNSRITVRVYSVQS